MQTKTIERLYRDTGKGFNRATHMIVMRRTKTLIIAGIDGVEMVALKYDPDTDYWRPVNRRPYLRDSDTLKEKYSIVQESSN